LKDRCIDEDRSVIAGRGVAPKEFSQLAELQVAGRIAEAGWRVYFPHRDDGFDLIALKQTADGIQIRPVQVKGKYLKDDKTDKRLYGYIGKLTQTHPEIVLAIPYFAVGDILRLLHVALMPLCMVRQNAKGWRCLPAKFIGGPPSPRGDHKKYFAQEGLKRLESRSWRNERLVDTLIDEDDE
jgi:hypothetical protein